MNTATPPQLSAQNGSCAPLSTPRALPHRGGIRSGSTRVLLRFYPSSTHATPLPPWAPSGGLNPPLILPAEQIFADTSTPPPHYLTRSAGILNILLKSVFARKNHRLGGSRPVPGNCCTLWGGPGPARAHGPGPMGLGPWAQGLDNMVYPGQTMLSKQVSR